MTRPPLISSGGGATVAQRRRRREGVRVRVDAGPSGGHLPERVAGRLNHPLHRHTPHVHLVVQPLHRRSRVASGEAGGDLIHLARMDGASALNARMSYNKAYTATKWQRDTRAIKERLFDMSLGNDRREVAWFCDPLYTPVWGGIVLRSSDGTMLGAIGESGGTPEQDEEIGQLGKRVFEGV